MKDFDTFTKIAKNVGNLVKMILATGFEKLPKSAINHPIWSHWLQNTKDTTNRLEIHFLRSIYYIFEI